ncbi:hypothetical protein MHAS_04954 [Mycolicibacterium hassiacum DSM 44199]|jgi:hypothetical protein|nr:hypothetical protein MHAS_04954 [Mycolicibacterium hassiacum DSM 44199]
MMHRFTTRSTYSSRVGAALVAAALVVAGLVAGPAGPGDSTGLTVARPHGPCKSVPYVGMCEPLRSKQQSGAPRQNSRGYDSNTIVGAG